MGRDQSRRRAGPDVARQLLRRGQLRQLRCGDGGLVGVGVALRLRRSGQKIQQLRLFGIVRGARLGGRGLCPGLLCGQRVRLPLHCGDDVLTGLGGAAVEHTSGLLQAAGRLAGCVDVKDLGLRLLLGGHLCLLQVEDDLLRVGGGVHCGGVTGFASAKQHDSSSRFFRIDYWAAVSVWL